MGARAMIGLGAGMLTASLVRLPQRLSPLESLMPEPPAWSSYMLATKPVPKALLVDRGPGTDFETRPSSWKEYLTPTDRFYLRSHSPTPAIDIRTWHLVIDGTGARKRLEISYDELLALPQTTLIRTIECAGNGRRFFKEALGVEAEGSQWGTGAMGCAEWAGVRLRDLLERAGLTSRARDVMPEGLDDHRVRRPMPLQKALRDDTLVALKMNGQTLPMALIFRRIMGD
jgi:DMSO/TMAO reductase YedYZ molybdopterin-dependent catalytic subunit